MASRTLPRRSADQASFSLRVASVHTSTSSFSRGEHIFEGSKCKFEFHRSNQESKAILRLVDAQDASLATVAGTVLWSPSAATARCKVGETEQVLVFVFEEEQDVGRMQAASTFAQQTNAGSSQDYFFNYARLDQQQNMLMDTVRTGTYRNAVAVAADAIRGKVVMDVGTGSGILAMFCARMGARKVYAVEASAMAKNAEKLIAGNGLQHIIEVVNGRVEEVDIPEKVDVLISEPMGNLLLSERMIESYVAARDRFLRPGGLMLPGSSTIYVAPYTDAILHSEPWAKSVFWQQDEFQGENLTALHQESVDAHYRTPVVDALNVDNLLAPATQHHIDFHTVTKDELQNVQMPLSFECTGVGVVHGVACWFDVTFDAPGDTHLPIILHTGPGMPLTHWWQCALLVKDPIAVNPGQKLSGLMIMDAHHMQSYYIDLTLQLLECSVPPSKQSYDLKNPLYRCVNHHQIPIPTSCAQLPAVQSALAKARKRSSTRANNINDAESTVNDSDTNTDIDRNNIKRQK